MKKLQLSEVKEILTANRVVVGIEDDRNAIEIASGLELIGLAEVDTEAHSMVSLNDKDLLDNGQIVLRGVYGHQILQAVAIERRVAL